MWLDGPIDDREAFSQQLELVPLLDLRTVWREVGQVARCSNSASPFCLDGVPDGWLSDDYIEVETAVAEGGAVDVVLRSLDGELDRMAMGAHQDELDYLVGSLRLANEVARTVSDSWQFPKHIVEDVPDAVEYPAIDCDQIYVREVGMYCGAYDVFQQAAKYVEVRYAHQVTNQLPGFRFCRILIVHGFR